MMTDAKFELMTSNSEETSPYDVSYPVYLLSCGIKKELEQAQMVAQSIYRAVIREMPTLTQVRQAMDEGCRYVVDASESTLKAIESGTLKLTQEHGKTYEQYQPVVRFHSSGNYAPCGNLLRHWRARSYGTSA